jgi:hypothetical protein
MLSIERQPQFYGGNAEGRDFLPFMRRVRILTEKNFVCLYHRLCDSVIPSDGSTGNHPFVNRYSDRSISVIFWQPQSLGLAVSNTCFLSTRFSVIDNAWTS